RPSEARSSRECSPSTGIRHRPARARPRPVSARCREDRRRALLLQRHRRGTRHRTPGPPSHLPAAATRCKGCSGTERALSPRTEFFMNSLRGAFPIAVASSIGAVLLYGLAGSLQAQASPPAVTLFENVRIFDGTNGRLSGPSHVLVRGNRIERISTTPI